MWNILTHLKAIQLLVLDWRAWLTISQPMFLFVCRRLSCFIPNWAKLFSRCWHYSPANSIQTPAVISGRPMFVQVSPGGGFSLVLPQKVWKWSHPRHKNYLNFYHSEAWLSHALEKRTTYREEDPFKLQNAFVCVSVSLRVFVCVKLCLLNRWTFGINYFSNQSVFHPILQCKHPSLLQILSWWNCTEVSAIDSQQ